ncbi:hypothetical protein ACWGJW_30440, partial [Streptomyces nigrescens]
TGTGAPIRLDGEFTRDEAGQATYLRELVEIFDTNGVDSAFAFLFALDNFPHRPDGDPRDDLDLASPGIVKVLDNHLGDTYPDMPWEPKTAFTALAASYRAWPRRTARTQRARRGAILCEPCSCGVDVNNGSPVDGGAQPRRLKRSVTS